MLELRGCVVLVKPNVVALRTLKPLEAAVRVGLRNRHDASAGVAARASAGNRRGSPLVGHVQFEGVSGISVELPSVCVCQYRTPICHRSIVTQRNPDALEAKNAFQTWPRPTSAAKRDAAVAVPTRNERSVTSSAFGDATILARVLSDAKADSRGTGKDRKGWIARRGGRRWKVRRARLDRTPRSCRTSGNAGTARTADASRGHPRRR